MDNIEPIKTAPDNPTEKIAEESGLAVVLVDERGSVTRSNNNSICEVLESSEEFAPRCGEFCGRAFEMAQAAGEIVSYQCYAGLDCRAVPLAGTKKLVAIVGRTFTKAEHYRRATERAIDGDWRRFPPTKFFENVLISGSAGVLEKTAKTVAGLVWEEGEKGRKGEEETAVAERGGADEAAMDDERTAERLSQLIEEFNRRNVPVAIEEPDIIGETEIIEEAEIVEEPEIVEEAEIVEEPETVEASAEPEKTTENETPAAVEAPSAVVKKLNGENEEIAAWRSLFGSLFDLTYQKACLSIIRFLSQRYGLGSMAWLERRENQFEGLLATGSLEGRQFKIVLPADDRLLFQALENELSLDLRERARAGEPNNPQTISLFPVSVGGEVQCALVVADPLPDEEIKRHISRFCKTVASELEILRLREEVKRRNWLADAVEKFNASLKNIDTDDFWSNLTRVSAELMRAERSSLLVFDEKSDLLTVKAAVGATADRIRNQSQRIGDRVARIVLQNGKPVVVSDVSKIGLQPAPPEWKYKTKSFISYPFSIGSRRVGVLNVTDKADGKSYSEYDLELLNAIAPQVAVLIDRASLKSKAGEFEQLSVTDSLTGLLNRRYLEERIAEEIKRSNRYGYPMCFMMIDVDDFKVYNDTFGHIEGDRALTIVGRCLRETLRSADVAARYGGEEFSILLPQTTPSEAETIAERLREKIAATEFPNRQVTVSIGIAGCCLELNSARDLIHAADIALFDAKRGGKNTVRLYDREAEHGDK
ncbi:MAG: diguanylate cyclase [Acidobacteria bacterium]|nr:diguanylate cyclase [Acidobacteriota bacterium]